MANNGFKPKLMDFYKREIVQVSLGICRCIFVCLTSVTHCGWFCNDLSHVDQLFSVVCLHIHVVRCDHDYFSHLC